jgi:hypothetical protein
VTNVNQNNNLVYFSEEDGPLLTAILNPGNYTGTTLAAELKRVMDDIGSHTYTVTFNSITSKLTVATNIPNVYGWRFSNTFRSAALLLGFPDTDSDNLTAFISTDPIRLDYSLYYDIITNLGSGNMSSSGRYSILARIANTTPPNTILFYENQNDADSSVISNDLNQIEIRLVDDKGNVLPLNATAHISYTFRIEFM